MRKKLLQGSSVRLTALNQEDLPTVARWHHDAEFLRLFDSRPASPKSSAQLARWLEDLHKGTNAFAFAIRRVQDEELIGFLELDGIDWQHGVCWLGVGIGDRTHWGQGYGREAIRLALEFAFDELNLHRVQASVFAYNSRSRSLFESLGFQCEGALREFLNRNGMRHDMLMYGQLRHEWQALQIQERQTRA